jgi:hypothetical protein
MHIASFPRPIISLPVACLVVPRFSTLSQKRHDFRKGVFENITYALTFPTAFFSEIIMLREV